VGGPLAGVFVGVLVVVVAAAAVGLIAVEYLAEQGGFPQLLCRSCAGAGAGAGVGGSAGNLVG